MAGTILIRRLAADCVIGTRDWERRTRQRVLVDLAIGLDITASAASDDLEDALDYVELKNRLLHHLEGSRYQLLEALAASICEMVLQDRRVTSVEATVDKPGALTGTESVAVRLARAR